MKKYGVILVLLLCCIFTSMISNTAAIYTHSDTFDFDIKFIETPVANKRFVKYELSNQRMCDYNRPMIEPNPVPPARNCAQGSATFDGYENTVKLSQDAGYVKYFKGIEPKYKVNGSFVYNSAQSPMNFGMYFNGSFYQIGENEEQGKNSMRISGFVLLFDNNGNLVINEQGIENTIDSSNHKDDKLKTFSDTPDRNIPIASKQQVTQILQAHPLSDPSMINLQVNVEVYDNSKLKVYVYINGALVNPTPAKLRTDIRGFNGGGILDNIIIGACTYGEGASVMITHMEKEVWDGTI